MRLFKTLLLISLITMLPQSLFAINTKKIATIDLQLALTLHPKMALYDYNRNGFAKIPLGLSMEEFEAKTKELLSKPIDNSKEIEKQSALLNEIYKEKATFQDSYANKEINDEYLQQLEIFEQKANTIRSEIENLNWESKNSDLTSRKETKRIFQEIETDVFNAINEVKKELDFDYVLNTSLTTPRDFNESYIALLENFGLPGVNFSVFYAFYLWKYLVVPSNQEPLDSPENNWNQLIGLEEINRNLPLVHYPTLLSGGTPILKEVIKKLYEKENIHPSIMAAFEPFIEKMTSIQNGIAIDKKVVIENETK